MWNFQLFPEQASAAAAKVDHLYFFLVGISGAFSFLIFILIVRFAVKYRRRSETERPPPAYANVRLEVAWIVIPLILAMVMFGWGASVFFELRSPPRGASEIYVVGKQWMWKIQHPTGQREINELHVPLGVPVKLVMTSEDVIHSFYVPAFRTKMDVLPGRYTTLWFTATRAGRYHLFCAEYCGTGHSKMIGSIHVLEPPRYQEWLEGGVPGETLAQVGERLFQQIGCATCHAEEPGSRGPSLRGLFGSTVRLKDGTEVLADENYLRESILRPSAKVVSGFDPVMPAYEGQISEEDLLKFIAWIKSLAPVESRSGKR
jgi:cytochrome c oxidase subunit 2